MASTGVKTTSPTTSIMDDLPVLVKIAIAVFGTGGAGVVGIKMLKDWARTRRSKHMDAGFADMNELYQTLQTLLGSISADRILIIKSENGGGLPRPGCEIKSSVVHEVYNGKLGSLYEMWQRVPFDHEYSEILSVLSTGQWVWRTAEQLHSRSVLRDLLEEDVKRLAFARICGTNNALWYIALHFRSSEKIDDSERARTQQAIYRLRVLFGNHQALVKTESNE